MLNKFCWACESYGVVPNVDTFCTYYELQKLLKKVKVGGVELVAQYGSCAFMAKRSWEGDCLEISWCQKNKWDHDWMKHWFYVKTSSMTRTYVDGTSEVLWPLASVMSEMAPLLKVNPPAEITPEREACDRAIALACHYSGGQDLVEEMVTSNFWPLQKRNKSFHTEMVQVPVFGPAEGLPFPRFDRALPPDQDKDAFILEIEEATHQIIGKMSARSTSLGGLSAALCRFLIGSGRVWDPP
jgi:hypothetical protein